MAEAGYHNFQEAFQRLKERQSRIDFATHAVGDFMAGNISEAELRRRLTDLPPAAENPVPPKRWDSLLQMREDLNRIRDRIQPAPPKVNPDVRKKQIEDELDIIRGRKPTPAGYRIDTGKIKALMAELKQINEH